MRFVSKYFFMSLQAAIMVTACNIFEDGGTEHPSAVYLTLSIDGDSIGTKADSQWKNLSEARSASGVDYDNYISISGLDIRLFDAAGTAVESDVSYIETGDASHPYEARRYIFKVTPTGEAATGGDFTLAVFSAFPEPPAASATWPEVVSYYSSRYGYSYYSGAAARVDNGLADMFSDTGGWYKSAIPMWGFRSFTPGSTGTAANPVKIPMLRAMSKVTVALSEDFHTEHPDIYIHSVYFKASNTAGRGWCLPVIPSGAQSSEDCMQEGCFNLRTADNPALTADLPFTVHTLEDSTDPASIVAASVYIPEMAQVSGTDGYIYLTLSDDTTIEHRFNPKAPKSGDSFDGNYRRNHHYVLTVGKTLPLDIHLAVLPWNVYRDYRTWIERDTDDTAFIWDETKVDTTPIDGERIIRPDVVADCSFVLDADLVAEGGFWYASFEYTEGQYGTFQFCTGDPGSYTYSTSVTGSLSTDAQPLHIRIDPDVPAVDTKAVLRIVVKSGNSVTRIQYPLNISGVKSEYTVVRKL